MVALWSSGRHLASGSEGPGFESWLCQVDVKSLGKALYMDFPHPNPFPKEKKKLSIQVQMLSMPLPPENIQYSFI